MNLEKGFRIAKSKLNSDYLVNSLNGFANVLAANRWRQTKIQEVALTRSVTETLGDDYEMVDEDSEITTDVEPITSDVTISFHALKRIVELDGDEFSAPHFHLTTVVNQRIIEDEIPARILDEILEDQGEDEDVFSGGTSEKATSHPLNDLLELPDGMNVKDNLDELDLERSQSVAYEINHNGTIENYSIDYVYKFNGIGVFHVGYDYETSHIMWRPVQYGEDTGVDRAPLVLATLDEDAIATALKDIDDKLALFLLERSTGDLMAFTAVPKEEHIRRILGSLSMVAGGIMRI